MMRALLRPLSILVACALTGVAVYSFGWQWLVVWPTQSTGDGRPARAVPISSLPRYTRAVSGKTWFRRYFMRMAFDGPGHDATYTGVLARWQTRRVQISVPKDGIPGTTPYLRRLVRRLNRIQRATRFVLTDGVADISIRYLSHIEYLNSGVHPHSIGSCSTKSLGDSGLARAVIIIDASEQTTRQRNKATLIHELTHALGFNGHFRESRFQHRSVLYYASTATDWSRADAAAIRIMYSAEMRSGMTPRAVARTLKRIQR